MTRPKDRALFLNLSGGIDSTYAAWRLLRDGYRLILHHCVLRNREGRGDVEHQATERVVDWLRANNLGRLDYRWSVFDLGTLTRRLPYDVEIIGALTGLAMRDPACRNVATVVVSANASDPSVRRPSAPRIVRRRQAAELMAMRPLDWWIPFGTKTRAQMVAEMPSALLALCWWCRIPVRGKECGRCRTCRQTNALPKVAALRSNRSRRSA